MVSRAKLVRRKYVRGARAVHPLVIGHHGRNTDRPASAGLILPASYTDPGRGQGPRKPRMGPLQGLFALRETISSRPGAVRRPALGVASVTGPIRGGCAGLQVRDVRRGAAPSPARRQAAIAVRIRTPGGHAGGRRRARGAVLRPLSGVFSGCFQERDLTPPGDRMAREPPGILENSRQDGFAPGGHADLAGAGAPLVRSMAVWTETR